MNLLRAIRFAASIAVLCSVTFLAVDLIFILVGSSERGSWVYWLAQIGVQLFLVTLLVTRVIVIYTGPTATQHRRGPNHNRNTRLRSPSRREIIH
jgi:ABC-type arginine/histidine transport system permease subunit